MKFTASMNRFTNDNPFAPWNSIERDNPFKPWNGPDRNDPFAPWNDPFGRDHTGRYREYDEHNRGGW